MNSVTEEVDEAPRTQECREIEVKNNAPSGASLPSTNTAESAAMDGLISESNQSPADGAGSNKFIEAAMELHKKLNEIQGEPQVGVRRNGRRNASGDVDDGGSEGTHARSNTSSGKEGGPSARQNHPDFLEPLVNVPVQQDEYTAQAVGDTDEGQDILIASQPDSSTGLISHEGGGFTSAGSEDSDRVMYDVQSEQDGKNPTGDHPSATSTHHPPWDTTGTNCGDAPGMGTGTLHEEEQPVNIAGAGDTTSLRSTAGMPNRMGVPGILLSPSSGGKNPEMQQVADRHQPMAAPAQLRKNGRPSTEKKKEPHLATNRHEGHDCPRELRRLARLEEQRNAVADVDEVEAVSESNPTELSSNAEADLDTPQQAEGAPQPSFPGQMSDDASKSTVIASTSSPVKRRRKKKSKDPFDSLPVIKPWNLHQHEMLGIAESKSKPKKNEKRFKVSQFDDPFSQMLWALFRSADKDGDGKLNKRELNLILSSPKLSLSLTAADVSRLSIDCSSEEDADCKKCELSFEDFSPLGRLLLMLYYSKMDDSSQSKWCILDKGHDCGIIYFNKLTGHASTSVPTDFYADVLHEPDLLEMAIHDLLQTSDLNEDGKINLADFLRILRSEDFGLFLTNGDVHEITCYFSNSRGREIKLDFAEFVPLAKRLILIVFRGKDPSPHDWCHLYTRNVGSFWFNKRTGQAGRHPPTSMVRAQQDMLEHRSREIEVFTKVAEDLHHTREDLQKETKMREELGARLAEVDEEMEAKKVALSKTTESLERAKREVEQKSKQILLLEKGAAKQKSMIETLQGRAEEADRTASELEALQNKLQNTQAMVREKEFDVRDLTTNLEKTQKELTRSQQHTAGLQDRVDDLMMQLREEIRRNERVEKELEGTRSFKNEKVEVEDILKEAKEELEMRMRQLTHARYEIRDNKAKIRRLEAELNSVPDIQTELDEKEGEIAKLRVEIERLETELVQSIPEPSSPKPATRYRWNKMKNVDTSDNQHECSDPFCPVNGKNAPPSPTPAAGDAAEMWAFKKTGQSKHHGSFLELLDTIGDKGDLNIYDFYEPDATPPRSPIARGRHISRPKSSAGRLETKKPSTLPVGVFLYEEDYLLAKFVKEGDRVRIKKAGIQILGMKPSDLRTATVRYIGQLEEAGGEHMLFAGLHMDDPVGNTNGVIDGKRYFYAKRRYGKMVRLTEVLYIFNTKTTSFDKLSDLVEEYKSSRRKHWQPPGDGRRLVKVT